MSKLVDFDKKQNNRDGYVYYVDPMNQKCPRCGVIGSIMQGACQNCACLIILSRKFAGKKEPLEKAKKRLEMEKVDTKDLNPKRKDEEFPVIEEDEIEEPDDLIFKEAKPMDKEEMAIQYLKEIKKALKDASSLLGEFFSQVAINFDPFKMEVSRKPKKLIL